MCLFWENVLILRSEGFRILGIVYTVDSSIRNSNLEFDFLFITFKKFLTQKMFLVFLVYFYFVKLEKFRTKREKNEFEK